MLYHQSIEIGAYVLFLDGLPIEPKSARIVLTGSEDKLVSIGFDIHFRLRDLLGHIHNVLQRSSSISQEMVDWFMESLPITRTIATFFTLNKAVFRSLEDEYYNCESIDQFLKIKLDPSDILPPLLNLELYELVALEVVTDDTPARDRKKFMGAQNVDETDTAAYVGVVSRLVATQVTSAVKAAVFDLFSMRPR